MKQSLWIVFLSFFGPLFGCGGNSPNSVSATMAVQAANSSGTQNLAGAWTGIVVGTYMSQSVGPSGPPTLVANHYSYDVTLIVAQTGGDLSGTWQTNGGTSGTLAGTIDASGAVAFSLLQLVPYTGSYQLSGPFGTQAMAMSVQGTAAALFSCTIPGCGNFMGTASLAYQGTGPVTFPTQPPPPQPIYVP